MFLPDFVCLFVCQQDNSKSYGRIFMKFWGYVGNGTNYQWLNFGDDPEGILDSWSLWNFRYRCFQWGIRETAAKPKMVLPPSEQHIALAKVCGLWLLSSFIHSMLCRPGALTEGMSELYGGSFAPWLIRPLASSLLAFTSPYLGRFIPIDYRQFDIKVYNVIIVFRPGQFMHDENKRLRECLMLCSILK